jgi:hypothetical protein
MLKFVFGIEPRGPGDALGVLSVTPGDARCIVPGKVLGLSGWKPVAVCVVPCIVPKGELGNVLGNVLRLVLGVESGVLRGD